MENSSLETIDLSKESIFEEDFIITSIEGRMKTTTKDIYQERDIDL